LKLGYFVQIIPATLFYHFPHKKGEWWRYHFESPVVRIKHRKVGVDFFFNRSPVVMFLRMAGYIYYKYVKKVQRYTVIPVSKTEAPKL